MVEIYSDQNQELYEDLFNKIEVGDRDGFRERFLTLHERDQQELLCLVLLWYFIAISYCL